MDRTERFYRIDALLREREVVPIETFLEELEISRATFKRDLEYLRDRLHAPIEWDRGARGYRFTDHAPAAPRYALPGLWLNEAEIRALLALRELLEKVHPGLLGPHVEPLIDRARDLLGGDGEASSEVARRVRILHAPRREVRSAEFGTICEALLARRRVRVVHYSRPRDETLSPSAPSRRSASCTTARTGTSTPGATFGTAFGASPSTASAMRRWWTSRRREIADFTLDRDLGAGYGIFAGAARASPTGGAPSTSPRCRRAGWRTRSGTRARRVRSTRTAVTSSRCRTPTRASSS